MTFGGPAGREENGSDNVVVGSASLDKELNTVLSCFKRIWVMCDQFCTINLIH